MLGWGGRAWVGCAEASRVGVSTGVSTGVAVMHLVQVGSKPGVQGGAGGGRQRPFPPQSGVSLLSPQSLSAV